MRKNTIEDFWNLIDKTSNPNGCWEWLGCKDNRGYGVFRLNGKIQKCHRISKLGDTQSKLFVCHQCDNPGCVCPDHLFLGNHNDNMRDRDLKGRTLRGQSNAGSKLTETQILEIRNTEFNYLLVNELAKKYNVSSQQIRRILKRISWKHI